MSVSSRSQEANDSALDARRYLDALRRNARMIVGIAVLVTVVVVVVTHLSAKTYQTAARVIYNPTASALVSQSESSTQRQLTTYESLVTAPNVLARAASHLSEPASVLKGAISASAEAEANLLSVTATAHQPALAARRANAVAEAFVATEQATQDHAYKSAQSQLEAEIGTLRGTPEAAAQITALQERISALQIDATGIDSELQIVEPATAPSGPSSPRTTLDAIIALFVTLLIGVLVALGRDQLRPRFASPRELGIALDMPVLAGIPYRLSLGITRRRLALRGLEHEAFDALQATIRLLGSMDKGGRVLMVTSAVHGEGKTTVTASLARSLARAGQRTLVISGDLRSPTVHDHFKLPQSPGLSDYLSDRQGNHGQPQLHPADLIKSAPGELNLDLLPPGDVPADPSSLMSGSALTSLMESVREMDYDYVLIDSTPFLGLGDAQFLARQADDLLLVARLDRVGPEQVEGVRTLLERLQLSSLGVVVVGAKVDISPYYVGERTMSAQT
jgi:capsular exopolysaccharide synthesis family protein